MSDIVGQDDPVARDVERLAGTEQFVGELRRQKLASRAAGAVQDHHRVVDLAARVAVRLAERGVVEPHFGKRLAREETYVSRREIRFRRRPAGHGRGGLRPGGNGGEPQGAGG